MWLLHTLLCVTGLAPVAAFNVDVVRTWVTPEGGAPYVLSSLLHQDSSTNQTWLLVTSPSTSGTAEPLHQCSLVHDELRCHPVEHVSIPKRRYRGVIAVRNQHGVLNLLDPDAHVDAGVCSRNKEGSTENRARQRRALKVEEEEEEEEEEGAGTEIAIILDGSGSIDPPDFQRAKDFISNMMKNVYEKCFECSFALVQYGTVIQTELDLQDSQDVTASLARVQNITQVGNVTKTASAMQHVLASVQVGDAFKNNKTYEQLKLIASETPEAHAFKVTNYMALDGLLSKLQQSIIRVEGTVGDAPHYQLAQVGFSAQILDEGQVLLGAVGAFDWSGGVLLYDTNNCRGHFLNQTVVDAKAAQYGYLGYSVAVLHKPSGLAYVAGAPRHRQRGAVFELQEGRETDFVPVLEGEQMGSYFGSGLCPVDIDMDGTTDFLLVAAPFYHIQGEEGRVYMYRVNKQDGSFSLERELIGHSRLIYARFGFAMATVGDISQDKLTDVAIGAPLEDFGADDGAGFGSVYIYNGRSTNQLVNLSTSWSQRIRASAVAPGLHYFGMSVAGGLDFSGDGLADITVGALGRAAVLCSRPVVPLKVSMNFAPNALPIGFSGSVNACLCFEISSETTAAKSGLRETALNFTLDLDVMMPRKRLQCSDERACRGSLRDWDAGPHLCKPFLLIPTEGQLCQEDCFSNISIRVSYQLQTPEGRRDHPQPVLDLYTEPSTIFQLPYEKACRNKLFCVAELQLATTVSQQELVVGLTKELTMNITCEEDKDKPPSPNIQCDDPKPAASVLVMNCKIGHPILKRSSITLSLAWQLEESTFPNRTANITVMITNFNERRSLVSKTHSLQFKHAFIAVLPKPSVMYMNTSRGLSDHKEFLFNIHGENLFGAEFLLKICVPIKLQGLHLVRVKNLTKTQAHTVCTQTRERVCGSDPVQLVEEWHSVSCNISSDKENVTVAAELSFSQSEQLPRDVTELQILGEISFNKSLYEGLNSENHRTKITVIFLKDEEAYSLPLIIKSSVGGLLVLIVIVVILVKCGFFKRKYQQLNLESIRKDQLKSESLLDEEN
nr:integrin alpha-E [Vicugna pacos]